MQPLQQRRKSEPIRCRSCYIAYGDCGDLFARRQHVQRLCPDRMVKRILERGGDAMYGGCRSGLDDLVVRPFGNRNLDSGFSECKTYLCHSSLQYSHVAMPIQVKKVYLILQGICQMIGPYSFPVRPKSFARPK